MRNTLPNIISLNFIDQIVTFFVHEMKFQCMDADDLERARIFYKYKMQVEERVPEDIKKIPFFAVVTTNFWMDHRGVGYHYDKEKDRFNEMVHYHLLVSSPDMSSLSDIYRALSMEMCLLIQSHIQELQEKVYHYDEPLPDRLDINIDQVLDQEMYNELLIEYKEWREWQASIG